MSEPIQAESLVIRRVLPAPPETVWAMWTEPEHFAAWYGPAGAIVEVLAMEVRLGGPRRIAMTVNGPNGPIRMWFAGEHVEVEPITRLAYTEGMSNEDGRQLSREEARVRPGDPVETQVIVDLEPSDGGTTITLTHLGVAADSPGATGWAMALDKLAERVTP